MDQVTLDALKASIAAWEKKAVAENVRGVSIGVKACPLCQIFFSSKTKCNGCPVSKKTGLGGCLGTPYEDTGYALITWIGLRHTESRDAFHAAAHAEVAFLRSLLPPDAAQDEEVK